MIRRIGIRLGEPYDLFGIYGLAVDHGADLAVASACIESDAAALEMASDGLGSLMILRSLVKRNGFHLEGALVNTRHKSSVEIAQSAEIVSLLDLSADHVGAGDYDLVSAARPKQSFHYTLRHCKVIVVMSAAVLEHGHLICRDISLVAFDSDYDLLAAALFGSLLECPKFHDHGGKPGVKRCVYLKLHKWCYLS